MTDLIPAERIEHAILTIRGQRVMLDADLAVLYGTSTKRLNEQVRRNAARFPDDFAFTLTAEEWADLKSQIATSSAWGGRRTAPSAFTEHGAVMVASVLNTPIAVNASVQVVRAFVRMRRYLASQEESGRRIDILEARADNTDAHLVAIYQALRDLQVPANLEPKRIGFRPDEA